MAAYVIWLDHNEAEIFHLSAKGSQKENLKKNTHAHSNSHVDARERQENEQFFHEIATKLKDAEEILIMGPGLAKNHLKTHFEKHHHAQLAAKIVGIESIDRMTENQVLEKARSFFKTYDAFH